MDIMAKSVRDKKVDLLVEAAPIFESIFPQYFFTMGSCLGIVRECRLLPWDDDIDCALLDKFFSQKKFDRLKVELVNAGFQVSTSEGKWVKLNARKHGEKLCFVILYISNDKNHYLRPAYKFPAIFFEITKTIDVYGSKLRVPEPAEQYLEFIYGSDWRTPIKDRSEQSLYEGKIYRRKTLLKTMVSKIIRVLEKIKRIYSNVQL